VALEATITGGPASVNIRKGCEGFEVMGILIAAMLAYPMPWRLRWMGLGIGVIYVYLLNLVRILGIFLTHAHRPEWAEAAHVTAGQTFIILLVVLYIFLWIEWVVGDGKSETTGAQSEAGR
jgi:exosortase/archaeosortase family protein